MHAAARWGLRPVPELGDVTYQLLTRRGAPATPELRAVITHVRDAAHRP